MAGQMGQVVRGQGSTENGVNLEGRGTWDGFPEGVGLDMGLEGWVGFCFVWKTCLLGLSTE